MAVNVRLRVNPVDCDAYGYCAEVVPELIWLDEWGYPVLEAGAVPPRLLTLAEQAVRACPRKALFLERVAETPPSAPEPRSPRPPVVSAPRGQPGRPAVRASYRQEAHPAVRTSSREAGRLQVRASYREPADQDERSSSAPPRRKATEPRASYPRRASYREER